MKKLTILKYLQLLFLLLYCSNMYAQKVVTGTVINGKTGNRFDKVEVSIYGREHGVFTDLKGKYSIVVPDTSTFLFYSYKGYQSKKVKVGNKTKIKLTLEEDTTYVPSRIKILKPAIYLYPTQEQDISLKIDFDGEILTTYPDYNNQWKVHAYPSGKLINKSDNRTYYYLFWEGDMYYQSKDFIYDKGFVVKGDSVLTFLQESLSKLGLSDMELNDFIVFWLPHMINNKYNFVYFTTGFEYDKISKNIVTPKPDSECRVFMEFKALNELINIEPQELKNTKRKGFTLIEWGGSEIKQTITIKSDSKDYRIE